MSPTSTKVDSLRNDMCEHVFDREDVSNTYKSNDYIEFYWRYTSPTSTNVDVICIYCYKGRAVTNVGRTCSPTLL